MTADLSALEPPAGGWTTDDLDALPEGHRRYELIDGALIVSPSPTSIHQTIAMRLGGALEESCPPEYAVTQAVEIRVSPRRSFIPDVLVITDAAAARRSSILAPHEVVLAVEVVSPSSVTMDRVAKAALYAQAGIPFYWRVETVGGIVVHACRLDHVSGVYVPVGEFADVLAVGEPWQIEMPIKRIMPRHYRPESRPDVPLSYRLPSNSHPPRTCLAGAGHVGWVATPESGHWPCPSGTNDPPARIPPWVSCGMSGGLPG